MNFMIIITPPRHLNVGALFILLFGGILRLFL
nr:MAG TPA: hypothetical protein [Caudoviricetes sp.]